MFEKEFYNLDTVLFAGNMQWCETILKELEKNINFLFDHFFWKKPYYFLPLLGHQGYYANREVSWQRGRFHSGQRRVGGSGCRRLRHQHVHHPLATILRIPDDRLALTCAVLWDHSENRMRTYFNWVDGISKKFNLGLAKAMIRFTQVMGDILTERHFKKTHWRFELGIQNAAIFEILSNTNKQGR